MCLQSSPKLTSLAATLTRAKWHINGHALHTPVRLLLNHLIWDPCCGNGFWKGPYRPNQRRTNPLGRRCVHSFPHRPARQRKTPQPPDCKRNHNSVTSASGCPSTTPPLPPPSAPPRPLFRPKLQTRRLSQGFLGGVHDPITGRLCAARTVPSGLPHDPITGDPLATQT